MHRSIRLARTAGIFLAGVVVGTLLIRPSAAQENSARDTGLRLNHVGIAVKEANFTQSVNFYKDVMGFRLAFQFPSTDNKPTTTYFQLSRDTFLEMAPASDRLPEGITHIGVEAADIKATVERLKRAGAKVDEVRVSGPTKALLANVTDPNGIRLELVQLTPDSLHKKAEDSWK